MCPIDSSLVSHPIIYGMFSRFGRQLRSRRLVVFFDRSRAKSTTDSFFVAQMTRFRPAQVLLRLDRGDQVQSAYQLVRGTVGLFFKPTNDGTPRNAERSFKPAQATTLLIGSKNLFPSFGRISRQLRIVTTLASTGATAIFLIAVWRDSILMQRCIAAMTTCCRCCIHSVNPFLSPRHEQYTTPFGQRPLPKYEVPCCRRQNSNLKARPSKSPNGSGRIDIGLGGWDRTSGRRAPNAECSRYTTPRCAP